MILGCSAESTVSSTSEGNLPPVINNVVVTATPGPTVAPVIHTVVVTATPRPTRTPRPPRVGRKISTHSYLLKSADAVDA